MSLGSGIYLIWDVDAASGIDPVDFLKTCAPHHPIAVQLRAKGRSTCPEELLQRLLKACSPQQIPLIINDRADWLQAGCSGLHLGQNDGPSPSLECLLGRSTHNLDQVRAAAHDPQVDHLGFGPISTTRSKVDALSPRGLLQLREAVRAAGHKPVIAIGGIHKEMLSEVKGHGAHGAAVIGAVFYQPDPPQAFVELCEAWQ